VARAVVIDHLGDARGLVAAVADEHHVAVRDGAVEVDDAALDVALDAGAGVSLEQVDPAHGDALLLGEGALHHAALALVLAGNDLDGVALTDVQGCVDVAAILDGLAAKNPEKLDWKTSIVDLLKLIDVDSSHSARVTLAKELGYSGDFNDSAAMNVWLHKQVLQKIVENGGKIPQNLLH
jgi:hypothetical protein